MGGAVLSDYKFQSEYWRDAFRGLTGTDGRDATNTDKEVQSDPSETVDAPCVLHCDYCGTEKTGCVCPRCGLRECD